MEKKEILLLTGAALLWLFVLQPYRTFRAVVFSPVMIISFLALFSLGMVVPPAPFPNMDHL